MSDSCEILRAEGVCPARAEVAAVTITPEQRETILNCLISAKISAEEHQALGGKEMVPNRGPS